MNSLDNLKGYDLKEEKENQTMQYRHEQEPLEAEENFRYSMFPIEIPMMWEMYKKAQSYFWTEEAVDAELPKDVVQIKQMLLEPHGVNKVNFIRHIVKFFRFSDGAVNEILERHLGRITTREYILWKNFQEMMEDIHSVVYSKIDDVYDPDPKNNRSFLSNLTEMPTIKAKIEWLHKWLCHENDLHLLEPETWNALQILKRATLKSYQGSLLLEEDVTNTKSWVSLHPDIRKLFEKLEESKPSLAIVIFIQAILEAVYFSSSFCAIFWFGEQGLLPGLLKANELISRDEGMHACFAIMVYKNFIVNKLSQEMVHQIIREAVDIESDFIAEALPKNLLGMNASLMKQYVEFVADQLVLEMGYEVCFESTNPFDFMEKQSISVRMNDFFKTMPVEYRKARANTTAEEQTLVFDEDF